jgi:hypothetical protein
LPGTPNCYPNNPTLLRVYIYQEKLIKNETVPDFYKEAVISKKGGFFKILFQFGHSLQESKMFFIIPARWNGKQHEDNIKLKNHRTGHV